MQVKTLCAHIAQALLTIAAVGMMVLQLTHAPQNNSLLLGHTIFRVVK